VAGRSHLDCLMNCISLRLVRCSGEQQGMLSAAKKPASSGMGIISTCACWLADRARGGEEGA
jgi:hypothetical protein